MDLHEYLMKYGYRGLSIMVTEFIIRSPEFQGKQELVLEIGTALSNLEHALKTANT